jgi:hypothetical protein
MDEAIFLSAGIPDPKRAPEDAATADSVAISAAVSALVHVALGRRILVWGGQPAITPMIWAVAEEMRVDYGQWVRLYQSNYFQDEFPEDNQRFQNVTYVAGVGNDREKSLLAMRERMFSDFKFTAAVFIGGMKGIIDEFELFQAHQPDAAIIPLASTGGATLEVARRIPRLSEDLTGDLDYVGLLHKHLKISVREARTPRPPTSQAIAEEPS